MFHPLLFSPRDSRCLLYEWEREKKKSELVWWWNYVVLNAKLICVVCCMRLDMAHWFCWEIRCWLASRYSVLVIPVFLRYGWLRLPSLASPLPFYLLPSVIVNAHPLIACLLLFCDVVILGVRQVVLSLLEPLLLLMLCAGVERSLGRRSSGRKQHSDFIFWDCMPHGFHLPFIQRT